MVDTGGLISVTGDTTHITTRLGMFQASVRMVAWADVMGARMASAIRAEAPVGKGPHGGRLRDATRYRRHGGVGLVRLEWHADGGGRVPYTQFVIRGTRAHDIVPKTAKMLHWTTPAGVGVFARRVHHPGTRPNDYPQRALRGMYAELLATFHHAFHKL